MKPKLIQPLISMFRSPSRMTNRTWKTELCARVVGKMFDDSAIHGLEYLRSAMDGAATTMAPKLKVSINHAEIAGVPCIVTEPLDRPEDKNILIYFHGGGFVSGSAQGYQNLLSIIAEQADVVVIAPNYRLSPEHTFPSAQDDCLAVSQAVCAENQNNTVMLGGDSAGGNLAISTALTLVELEQLPKIERLLLISPWVEPTAKSGSMLSNEANDIFTLDFLLDSYASHINQGDSFDQRVNFLHRKLSSLPVSYVQCGGGELFLDQINDFVGRAKLAGAEIKLDVYPTQFHDFQTLWPVLKPARQAIEKIAEFLRNS